MLPLIVIRNKIIKIENNEYSGYSMIDNSIIPFIRMNENFESMEGGVMRGGENLNYKILAANLY